MVAVAVVEIGISQNSFQSIGTLDTFCASHRLTMTGMKKYDPNIDRY